MQLQLTREKQAESDHVIISYKVVNVRRTIYYLIWYNHRVTTHYPPTICVRRLVVNPTFELNLYHNIIAHKCLILSFLPSFTLFLPQMNIVYLCDLYLLYFPIMKYHFFSWANYSYFSGFTTFSLGLELPVQQGRVQSPCPL